MLLVPTSSTALTILAHVILLLHAPMWPKSYNTGPQGTFPCHLVHHMTLSKTLMHIYSYEYYAKRNNFFTQKILNAVWLHASQLQCSLQ